MNEEVLKLQIKKLVARTSEQTVYLALQSKGLSASTAERLCQGKHTAGFKRRTVTAIREVLAEAAKSKVPA